MNIFRNTSRRKVFLTSSFNSLVRLTPQASNHYSTAQPYRLKLALVGAPVCIVQHLKNSIVIMILFCSHLKQPKIFVSLIRVLEREPNHSELNVILGFLKL